MASIGLYALTVSWLLLVALLAVEWDEVDARLRRTWLLLGVGWLGYGFLQWSDAGLLPLGPVATAAVSAGSLLAIVGAGFVLARPWLREQGLPV